ncbi:hypothetical protein DU504_14050 [Haloplanus salinus]|jgi:hypothetical protein|uniref:DUF1059 domain-containing protein n=1 Tax=Haloplanus salinus TaxID=1126245 RepID=A0A368NDP4_9EURY|nr:hypothetical protein [Haloplanus salinus]RCU48326.1 hypothetical protein DU504_14050 [Haloplanus salinus]
MTYKLACLADCDCVFYGDDPTDLGRRLRAHLDAAHGVPADPTELAALALPVAGVRPGESTARTVADATE